MTPDPNFTMPRQRSVTRRRFITGIATAATGTGALVLGNRYGLIPPDHAGVFGIGEPGVDGDGVFYRDSFVRFADIADGLSHTAFVGERSVRLNAGRGHATATRSPAPRAPARPARPPPRHAGSGSDAARRSGTTSSGSRRATGTADGPRCTSCRGGPSSCTAAATGPASTPA